MNNFNGTMEILAGLRSASVHRLKKTWNVSKINIFLIFILLTFNSMFLIININYLKNYYFYYLPIQIIVN